MGLFDKVKNLFTDEEYVDDEEDTVKIREVKKEENKLPTFMRNKIEKEESAERELEPALDFNLSEKNDATIEEEPKAISKVEINNNVDNDSSSVSSLESKPKEVSKYNFRMFDDEDFVETRSRSSRKPMTSSEDEGAKEVKIETITSETFTDKKEKVVKVSSKNGQELKVASLYKDKKETKKENVRGFKATPIISPIYGVLDRNYQPSDISQNTTDDFVGQRASKNLDFDSVRKKAYGSLAEEIKENLMCENCEYLREAKQCHKRKEKIDDDSEDLMYNMFDDDKCSDSEEEVENDITIGDAIENYYDYGKGYEPISTRNNYDDVREEMLKQNSLNNDVKIVNNNDDDIEVKRPKKKEVPPVKSKINLLSTLKKSNGSSLEDEEEDNNKPENKDLELTDDLFSFIDSMYEERND